jgi:AraC-like DNA-binding protein
MDNITGEEPLAKVYQKAYQEELTRCIASVMKTDGVAEPLKGLYFHKSSTTTGPMHSVARPSLCVITQGAKEVHLGQEKYRYAPYLYLLTTVDLPVIGQVVEASVEKPYLSLRLTLDPALVASVLLETGIDTPQKGVSNVRALSVSSLDTGLLEAVMRLARLTQVPPTEARVLLPLVMREIIFRLLVSEQSARLQQMVVLGENTVCITRAIERLRRDYNKPLRIDDLAKEIGMSVSAFYQHFKAVTAMSPLQFQKRLRLQEARLLLLGGEIDAATAGHRVGYEDASQFSKEYKRLFGDPPLRDVERLRQAGK